MSTHRSHGSRFWHDKTTRRRNNARVNLGNESGMYNSRLSDGHAAWDKMNRENFFAAIHEEIEWRKKHGQKKYSLSKFYRTIRATGDYHHTDRE